MVRGVPQFATPAPNRQQIVLSGAARPAISIVDIGGYIGCPCPERLLSVEALRRPWTEEVSLRDYGADLNAAWR